MQDLNLILSFDIIGTSLNMVGNPYENLKTRGYPLVIKWEDFNTIIK